MSFNVAWILINAANGTCCKNSRIKQAREAQGIPSDNYDRYYEEFDFSITEEDIKKVRVDYRDLKQERNMGIYKSYNDGQPQKTRAGSTDVDVDDSSQEMNIRVKSKI